MRLPDLVRNPLRDRLGGLIRRRGADFVIGTPERPYMRRWWVIPRNRVFNIYLHQVLRDDDDRALHDHPWPSCSIILQGGYFEVLPGPGWRDGVGAVVRHWRAPGDVTLRRARAAHRLTLPIDREGNVQASWSLFITGPRLREWGFWCPQGWKHWQDFTAPGKPGETGPGCGDGP